MSQQILHACCLDVEGFGVLIKGASGSGKSSLMFGLIERLSAKGVVASIVSDDQTHLESVGGELVATAPPTIKDRAEIRGHGIVQVETVRQTNIGLIAKLCPDEEVPRMPEPTHERLLDVEVPAIMLPRQHEAGAVRIVLAWLVDHDKIGISLP